MKKMRYAQIGTGSRAGMYIEALCGDFKDRAELMAFCDTNHTRMEFWNSSRN